MKVADVETKEIEEKPEASEEVKEANGTTAEQAVEKDDVEAAVREENRTRNDQNGMTARSHWPPMQQMTNEPLTTLVNR